MKSGDVFSPKGMFQGTFIPTWLARMRLPGSAKLIYGRAAQLDNGSGVVSFEQKWMADEVGADEKTVRTAIKTLEAAGLLRHEELKGVARLAHLSHSYAFTWHPAIDSAPRRGQYARSGPGETPTPEPEDLPVGAGSNARSNIRGEETQQVKTPPTPPRAVHVIEGSPGGAPWPSSIGGVAVKAAERELADAILDEFNRQAGTGYDHPADHRRPVVSRIREDPSLTLDDHATMIGAVLAVDWWKRKGEPPTPRIVYGNQGVFEQAREHLRSIQRAAQTGRQRSQALDASMAEGRARHEAEVAAASSPEARAAAAAARVEFLARRRGGEVFR